MNDIKIAKVLILIAMVVIVAITMSSFFAPLFIKTSFIRPGPEKPVQAGLNEPPEIKYLMEDTITYFKIPSSSQLTIDFEHKWGYGDSFFRIFDQSGGLFKEISFQGSGAKNVFFEKGGTYKMAAFGANFRYGMKFSGPRYGWNLVALSLPHKPLFRVESGEAADVYFPVSGSFEFFATHEWDPASSRDGLVRVYDKENSLKAEIIVPSDTLPEAFEQKTSLTSPVNEFWRAEISGQTSQQSRIGIWTSIGSMEYPTGLATLLAPDEKYYFLPEFKSRDVDIIVSGSSHMAFLGAGDAPPIQYAEEYVQKSQDLGLSVSKYWINWKWRERDLSGPVNDNSDPFEINWNGFNFQSLDEDFSEYFIPMGIQPIMTFKWNSDGFLNTHPIEWTQNDMDEYAEYVLATVIHCAAPDLIGLTRDPYNINSIQILNEPNLLLEVDQSSIGRQAALERYVDILQTVSSRLKAHPDQRIQNIRINSPGIGVSGIWGETEKEYWVTNVLEKAGNDVDIVSWDQYKYGLVEELDRFGDDQIEISQIMSNLGYSKDTSLSEFNIAGGYPTSHYFFGSSFSKIHLFGAVANSVNNGMKYPVYFMLYDSGTEIEPRFKGLITAPEGYAPVPPYTTLPPMAKKPQYFAMEALGKITSGTIFSTDYTNQQIDVISSMENGVCIVGISNRYEAPSRINLNIPISGGYVKIYSIEDAGIALIEEHPFSGAISLEIPAWQIRYLEISG